MWFAHSSNSKIVHRPCRGRLRFVLALWAQHAFWRIAQGVDSNHVLADCSGERTSAVNVQTDMTVWNVFVKLILTVDE